MNRRERRAASKKARLDPRAVAYVESYKCPDCDSVPSGIWLDANGVHHATILHDATCPRLRGITT